MNQTDPGPAPGPQSPPSGGFDATRVRSVGEMRRSSDDRLVAGVCGGAGRHLGIDPILVRVILAVLCLAGLAGLIIYVAVWVLVPADDAARSHAAQWFDLGSSEPQVRSVGLILAGVLALVAVVGDSSWGFASWPLWLLIWIGLPAAALYWLFAVRLRRDRSQAAPPPAAETAPMSTTTSWSTTADVDVDETSSVPAGAWAPPPGAPQAGAPVPPPPPPRPRRPFSWALTLLTLSITAITLAGTYLWSTGQDEPLRWTVYVAIALGLTALGLLVGTVLGNAGPLIPLGLLLVCALLVGAVLPSLRAGHPLWEPGTAAETRSEYTLGMGRLTLDLTDVANPEALEGRTVRLRHGLGETIVVVPDDVEVELDASLTAGGIELFDRRWDGTGLDVEERTTPTGRVLTLEVEQSMGQVRVVRR